MEQECKIRVCIRRNRWEPTEWIICDEDYDGEEEKIIVYLLCNGFPGVPNRNSEYEEYLAGENNPAPRPFVAP